MAPSLGAPLTGDGDHTSAALGAPLMRDGHPADPDHSDGDGDGDGGTTPYDTGLDGASDSDRPNVSASATPSLFVFLLTLAAGISGLLFGYDTGVISATLVSVDTSLSNRTLTSLDKSLITSSTSLFALFASPLSSVLADRYGRRAIILYADVLFALGAVMQAASRTVAAMVAGRCVVGAAIGAASFAVPLYLAEVAPAAHRGRLVTLNVVAITLGQAVAYVVGWALAEHAAPGVGWRLMVGLGAGPAVLQAAITACMPETPRWLVRAGRVAEARRVVLKVGGDGATARGARHANAVVKEIELEVREERDALRKRARAPGRGRGRSRGWLGAWDELLGQARNRRALAIACLLQGLQQLCGFNSLMYFSATIFAMVGFDVPTLTSLSVAVTNLVFTVGALFLIDRIGRRRILLVSVPFMILGLLLSARGFSQLTLPAPALSSPPASPSPTPSFPAPAPVLAPAPAPPTDRSAATLILASIMLYVAAYALGLGTVPWMQSELFPLAVRSLGSGIATGTNWAANFAVGLTFLPMMDVLGPAATFVLYASVCAVGYALVAAVYPETAGLSLEEAAALLEG